MGLQYNVIRPITDTILYLVKFQNSPVFSCLFNKSFTELLRRSIPIQTLLDSQIVVATIDLDEWPALDSDSSKLLKSYNGSSIQLHNQYRAIFGQTSNDPVDAMGDNFNKVIDIVPL